MPGSSSIALFGVDKWDWSALTHNPGLTRKVLALPDKPWDWRILSSNPSMLLSPGHRDRAAARIQAAFRRWTLRRRSAAVIISRAWRDHYYAPGGHGAELACARLRAGPSTVATCARQLH